MHLEVSAHFKEIPIHKALNKSIVQDLAGPGTRTAKCEAVTPSEEVVSNWRKVTCIECLKWKPNPKDETKAKVLLKCPKCIALKRIGVDHPNNIVTCHGCGYKNSKKHWRAA